MHPRRPAAGPGGHPVADPVKTPGDETFLSRWSRRKHAVARETAAPAAVPATAESGVPIVPAPSTSPVPAAPEMPLPPVESLTFDSVFTPFLRPGVAPDVRQSALRTLLRDPHFNVMDGLDVYIDDYTKPAPLSAAAVAGMVHARYIFAPPQTRVNAAGVVEDVPAVAEAPAEAASADRLPTHCAAGAPVARLEGAHAAHPDEQSDARVAQDSPDPVSPQPGGANACAAAPPSPALEEPACLEPVLPSAERAKDIA